MRGCCVSLLVLLYTSSPCQPNYLQAIRPAYEQQMQQMQIVMSTVNEPVFTSGTTTTVFGAQELAATKEKIAAAETSTSNLNNYDDLTILPGTGWQSSVAQTNKEFIAMERYVNDSKKLLTDFHDFINYSDEFNNIKTSTSMQNFTAAIKSIDGDTTPADLMRDVPVATKNLGQVTVALKGINAPLDLQSFNNTQESSVVLANNDLIDIQVGIVDTEDSTEVQQSISQCNQAYKQVQAFMNTYVTGTLGANSPVLSDITRVHTEHPLSTT